MSEPESADEAEIISLCAHCDDAANEIEGARADVIRAAGYVAVGMLPFLTLLSFADAVINRHPWQPEVSVLTGCVTALGGIMFFAFKTRGKE